MTDFSLGSATVAIKAKMDDFRRDLDSARKETATASSQMQRALQGVAVAGKSLAVAGAAIGAIGAGLATLIVRAANVAEAIQDTADRAGVTAERLQELRFAFTQNGASIQNVDAALTKLNAGLGTFVRSGAGELAEGLKLVGITSREAAAALGSGDAAINNVIALLAKIEDPAQRAGAAARLFGEEAGPRLAILIGQGVDEVDRLAQKARDMGLVLENEATRKAALLSAEVRALGEAISNNMTRALVAAAPEIRALAQAATDAIPELIKFGVALSQLAGFSVSSGMLNSAEADLAKLQSEIETMEANAPPEGAAERRVKRYQDALASLRAEADFTRQRISEMQRVLNPGETEQFGGPPVAATPAALPPVMGGGAPKPDAFVEAEQATERRLAQMDHERDKIGMVADAAARLEVEYQAAELRRDLFAKAMADGTEVSDIERASIRFLVEEYRNAGNAIVDARMAQELYTESQNAAKEAAEANARAVEAIGNQLTNAVNSADSFEDALKKVAVALINMAAQAALGAGPLGALVNGMLGVASGGLGGYFGGGAMTANPTAPGGLNFVPSTPFANGAAFSGGRVTPFAAGGVVNSPTMFPMANGAGLMGEAGPEAIMPLSRGPNGRLGVAMSGGGGQTINVDARGSTDPAATEAAVRRAVGEALARVPSVTKEQRRRGQL